MRSGVLSSRGKGGRWGGVGVGVVGEMEMPLGFGKVGFFLFFLLCCLGGMSVFESESFSSLSVLQSSAFGWVSEKRIAIVFCGERMGSQMACSHAYHCYRCLQGEDARPYKTIEVSVATQPYLP